MASSSSAVIKAIIGNGIVTVGKGTAAVFSGSGAMYAETIHSLVDTLNQCMLLFGQKRALSKPTKNFPYGFGPEANFWGLLAAVGVLIFGGLLTIQHAIHALEKPEMPGHIVLVIGILIFAIIVEGWVCLSIFNELKQTKKEGTGWWAHVKAQDSGTLAVILEDTAAMMGCFLAMFAIVACKVTGNGIYDAIMQLVIGIMLSLVGLYLIYANRGLLIGQALPYVRVQEISDFISNIDGIDHIENVKTRQLSAYTYRFKAEIVISGGELAGKLIGDYKTKALEAQDEKAASENLGRFAHDLFVEQAKFIDEIEKKIYEKFPGARYIDLEPHYLDE